ncbi:MAG: PilW family protein [Deltaproteobacteria bacterium]
MRSKDAGSTFVELMVAMLLTGLIAGASYSVYLTHQRTATDQEQVVEAQDNLRAAMNFLERRIRMAGLDPDCSGTGCNGIVTAQANTLTFTTDFHNEDSVRSPAETVTFTLADSLNDGDNDLVMSVDGGANQPIALNIDALDFVYLDRNGNVTANTDQIRAIQVTVVARTDRPDPGHIDTIQYQNQQGQVIFGPANDNFRRRLLTQTVKCRNLGV